MAAIPQRERNGGYVSDKFDALPSRGDVGLASGTRDSIFLLQERRWQFNHEGIPDAIEMDEECDLIEIGEKDPDGEPLVVSMAEVAKRWPDHVYEEWHVEKVFFTREAGERYAQASHYNYPHGWRVYCVCAEGELAALLKSRTLKPSGTLETLPAEAPKNPSIEKLERQIERETQELADIRRQLGKT